MTVDVPWIAAAAGAALAGGVPALAALLARRADRPTPPVDAEPKLSDGDDTVAESTLEDELAAIVDDAATALTGAPASNPDLGRNPLTGSTHTRVLHDPRAADPDAAPVRRPTTGTPAPLDTGDEPDPGPPGPGHGGVMLPAATEPDLDTATALADAFAARDVDTLAALAFSRPGHSFAAHLLAAAAAGSDADPRAYRHLHAAWSAGADPADVPELGPFLTQITFPVDVADAHVHSVLSCTRDHLALALAATEYAFGDVGAAHDVLTGSGPAGEPAALLAATTSLALGLPAHAREALRTHAAAATSGTCPPRWAPAVAAVAARAELEPGGSAAAACGLAAAGLDALADPDCALPGDERDRIAGELALASARADAELGDDAAAWETLTALLRRDPGNATARELLKSL